MRLLMIFIDGLGIGRADHSANPLIMARMPFLRGLFSGNPLTAAAIKDGIPRADFICLPVDATLGVPGLPQSATGQTAIFTGVNAAQTAGRHINGFPTGALRDILKRRGLFKVLREAGRTAVFANTFTPEYFNAVKEGKWRNSVTTTAALAGKCRLRTISDLINGEAVYQDITNEILREKGHDLPLYTPEEAGRNLIRVAAPNDFTLFEYFQTDRCGHHQDLELAARLLELLDRFVGTVAGQLRENQLDLLIVSDHGNIEDLSIKTHTFNPVPVLALGGGACNFRNIATLVDIYPAILNYFGINAVADAAAFPTNN